jgi:hypothetical protein
VIVRVPVVTPVPSVEQIAKAILAPRVQFQLNLPISISVLPEGQAILVPVVEVPDQVNTLGPDRAGYFEGYDHFAGVGRATFEDHIPCPFPFVAEGLCK